MDGSWALEDLLLFEPRVYWRLFALENGALWPAQPVLLAAGALLVLCLLTGRRPSGLWLGPALGAAWLWTGWQFVALRYGTVNWAAPALAWGFYAQAVLLAALGLSGRLAFAGRARNALPGVGLFAAALFVWPLLAPLDGRILGPRRRSWRLRPIRPQSPRSACWRSPRAAAGRRWLASCRRSGSRSRR